MPDHSLFLPNGSQVDQFDQIMRDNLASSLSYLAEVTEGHLAIDAQQLEQALSRLRANEVLPEVFAAYHELVMEVQEGNLDQAQELIEYILTNIQQDASFDIIPFKDPADDARSSHYQKQIDTDPNMPFPVFPASEADFEKAKSLIIESKSILQESCPELHDEIFALLRRVMVGRGPSADEATYTFDGASAFSLWGAIMLNAHTQKDVVDMIQTLAHESCHNLLFAYCIDDQLVENPDDELYASPLRVDPRPLDGIFHASFVLARMHYALAQIENSPRLTDELRERAAKEREQRVTNFYDGLSTLKAHARYTEIGQRLMNDAEAYMNQATGKP